MLSRVEVEFLSGDDNFRHRRTFERVKELLFVPDSYLKITSLDDGEMLVKFDRLLWYHSQPLASLGIVDTTEQQVLEAMSDGFGGYSNIIPGIKKHRELTQSGLKEAKDYCEKLRYQHGYRP